MIKNISDWLKHFFHVVSNVRPIIWLGLYILLVPVFALIYWWIPDGQFRIPDAAGTDFGSWLYYSIVTITTLGFGDYTPAHGIAQAVTAVEVMCGLIILGLFLNAVGSMKSEIDVQSEVEKQKKLHFEMERQKLTMSEPTILHNINAFMAYCYAVTTPYAKRTDAGAAFNPDFTVADMADLFKPSQLPGDNTTLPAVNRLLSAASKTALCLDSLQNRVDLSLWPALLDDCFAFVANFQMFSSTDALAHSDPSGAAETALSQKIAAWKGEPDTKADPQLDSVFELYRFIKENAPIAHNIKSLLNGIQ